MTGMERPIINSFEDETLDRKFGQVSVEYTCDVQNEIYDVLITLADDISKVNERVMKNKEYVFVAREDLYDLRNLLKTLKHIERNYRVRFKPENDFEIEC